jgi:glyoxylase-like metal-dependent hydrolase (beta-lactamase superfamily II)
MQIETIDLNYQGTPGVIAAFLIHGPEGLVLIETGPGSTLPVLIAELKQRGVEPADVRDVLVTHIHLDHSGAAGWWAQQGANVHVHPVGAPHIVDPSKLLKSATRIYGDKMDQLWGETLAAPAERVIAVEDGTTLRLGGLEITAIATHGHAWHHHVYRIGDVAFSGDAAGIKLRDSRWIDLPAPPPEFNLDAWRETLDKLRGMGLRTLYRTHFGAGDDANAELDLFEQVLEQGATWVREMMEADLDRESMVTAFTERMRGLAEASGLDAGLLHAYELANPRTMSVDGIARYWSKRI